jgi:hypothetical protein
MSPGSRKRPWVGNGPTVESGCCCLLLCHFHHGPHTSLFCHLLIIDQSDGLSISPTDYQSVLPYGRTTVYIRDLFSLMYLVRYHSINSHFTWSDRAAAPWGGSPSYLGSNSRPWEGTNSRGERSTSRPPVTIRYCCDCGTWMAYYSIWGPYKSYFYSYWSFNIREWAEISSTSEEAIKSGSNNRYRWGRGGRGGKWYRVTSFISSNSWLNRSKCGFYYILDLEY